MAESRKGHKKVTENWKTIKVLWKTGKNICAGNQKMTLLSHRNLEKLQNQAETGKHNLKFAEKKICPKVLETGNQKKRSRKAGKGRYFLSKPGNRPPITPPP